MFDPTRALLKALRQACPCLVFLLASAGHGAHAASTRPFVIAPVIEGLVACVAAAKPGRVPAPSDPCAPLGHDPAAGVARMLDTLEPGGARGDVQVGYVLTIQLLGLYRQQGNTWRIDEVAVGRVLDLLRRVHRPVVVYLAANHFDSIGPVAAHLRADAHNLMLLADGTPPQLDYFGHPVIPYTLLTDESLPVNRLRFDALRLVAARVAALPTEVRQRVIAITLGGELHHLFPDFARGMGVYGGHTTDYSQASQAAFRAWLARKYGSVARLNAAVGGDWRSFDSVQAPAGNALQDRTLARTSHYDGFAAGIVPVSGWLWDPLAKVEALELLVDGKRVATVARGFNRLDVYRTLANVTDPNVGFRHDLDVSDWAPGTYRLQVMARSVAGEQELGRSLLAIAGEKRSFWPAAWHRFTARVRFKLQPGFIQLPGVQGFLDVPQYEQRVLFNPLAREWDAFRAQQVLDFMAHLFRVAREAGLPADLLYSHQILPRANSSWNAQLFATDRSVDAALPWKQGFNTYGGAAGSDWLRQFVQEGRLADYGVPEFHPQQWKQPKAALDALQLHRRLGARFVSPYYLPIAPAPGGESGHAVKAMEIRPNNQLEGSDMLYQAIRTLAAQ